MKSIKAILCVAAVCMSLTSCEGGWLKDDKEQFLQSCRLGRDTPPGNREAYCQCRLEQTIKIYPTINGMVDNRDSLKLQEALQQCK